MNPIFSVDPENPLLTDEEQAYFIHLQPETMPGVIHASFAQTADGRVIKRLLYGRDPHPPRRGSAMDRADANAFNIDHTQLIVVFTDGKIATFDAEYIDTEDADSTTAYSDIQPTQLNEEGAFRVLLAVGLVSRDAYWGRLHEFHEKERELNGKKHDEHRRAEYEKLRAEFEPNIHNRAEYQKQQEEKQNPPSE